MAGPYGQGGRQADKVYHVADMRGANMAAGGGRGTDKAQKAGGGKRGKAPARSSSATGTTAKAGGASTASARAKGQEGGGKPKAAASSKGRGKASRDKRRKGNALYFGDNLDILRERIRDESVDLVYLDPPFNSKRDYNVLFKARDDSESTAQIQAFEDTWTWGTESAALYHDIVRAADTTADVVKGLYNSLGPSDMMAYLVMMTARLVELHRVLRPTGSLYLHCDPTASHYLKVVLDSIFGPENFKNEIVWKRSSGHPLSIRKFEAITDTILFYWKSPEAHFNSVTIPLLSDTIDKSYSHSDKHGMYASKDLTGGKKGGSEAYAPFKGVLPPKNRAWAPPTRDKFPGWAGKKLPKRYSELGPIEKCKALDKAGLIHWSKNGKPYYKRYRPDEHTRFAPSLWDDIKALAPGARERMDFATQKPLALLERIIKASSRKGDVVLDPFCGCGTAVHAAQSLGRRWIGIDVTHIAIGLIEYRMRAAFKRRPKVFGVPKTLESAQDLADRDKYQFELWAATRIDGIRPNDKKGADRGIDGVGQVATGVDKKGSPVFGKVIVSVKGGARLAPTMVRDLIGTVKKEGAEFGIFVCIGEPTAAMRREAAAGGMFETQVGTKHPRIQIFTVRDYFDGRQPDIPDIAYEPSPPRFKLGTKAGAGGGDGDGGRQSTL